MTEVCHNIAVEPYFQPLSGEAMVNASSINQNGARLDVAADDFWGSSFERAFFDVRIFNPYVPRISISLSKLTTGIMKILRRGHMIRESWRFSMEPSLHSSSHAPMVWVVLQ